MSHERVPQYCMRRRNVRPNVIYIQHESLSGSFLLNTEEGVAATPFFQGLRSNNSDFYVFENHRTGSGNTIDAMPALMTGCLPFEEEGIEYVRTKGRSIGYEFAERGYHTVSYSSRALDRTMKKGKWKMLYDMLAGAMDHVVDATSSTEVKKNNGQGSADAQMLPLFEKWLDELDAREALTETSARPFYAQFYNFNQRE